MLRPKRAATQKKEPPKEKKKEKDDDDELDLSEESSDDGDFSSASSDEWDPTVKKGVEETFEESGSEEEEDDAISDEEEESESFVESPVKQKKSRGNRSVVATLRTTPANKFKRNQVNRTSSSGNLQEILQRAEFKKKKSIFDNSREKTPDFDCSGGMHLSDSDDTDEGPSTSAKALENGKKPTLALINSINQSSGSTMVDLQSAHDKYQQMEAAKSKLINYKGSKSKEKSSQDSQKENFNIADLLAMGEGGDEPSTSKQQKSSQKRARNTQIDSEDDWEEVEDEEKPAPHRTPQEGVQIHLNNLNDEKKKAAKAVDLEAQMKRKLNRRRKEFQLCLHKVNLVSWISHGNFVNRKINDSGLMASALALLPKNKNHCYPKDQTDLDYFKQITTWFKSTISLRNKDMYCFFKPRPPIMMSLALQMKMKAAICRRDYVLIFAILLRAIGIQCRIVQSLVLAPIFPPKSDLLSLAKKPEEKSKGDASKSKSSNSKSRSKSSSSSKETKSSSSSKSKSSSSSKSKSSKRSSKPEESKKSPEKSSSRSSRSKSKKSEPPTIPQLDGGDDEASSSKPRRTLRIKALSGYQVDESYVDLGKDENSNPQKKKGNKQGEAESPLVTKMTPRLKISMDSPNRSSSTSDKLFKTQSSTASKNPIKKVVNLNKLTLFSPRKTRSMSRDISPIESEQPSTSKKDSSAVSREAYKKKLDTPQKDTLKLLSPRRLRSRSRSAEKPSSTTGNDVKSAALQKPNLKSLKKTEQGKRPSSAKEEVEAKKVKFAPQTIGTKRSAVADSLEVVTKKPKVSDKKEVVEDEDSDSSAKYFKETPKKLTKKAKPSTSTTIIDRRVLSSDSEYEAPSSPSKKSKKIDIWVEVYSEKDARWIAIDVFRGIIDCVKEIIKTATHPLTYVFAWNNDNSLKDVSARYCQNLNTTVRKMRVDSKYLDSVLIQYVGKKTSRDVKEDDELNQLLYDKPMPKSIAEFKNHPLYALKRHLLKYEAIYPPEPPILGTIREETIYPRDCVFVLHTRETWLKEARVVKLHEEPYKMTKTLKWDNVNRKLIRDVPQELFGIWQTKEYEPPVAENGIVPRNAYGNVELFKPQMLPVGCVHVQLPGLNKVCKKIGVDCSQAIVGFDSNGGWPYPVYDGFIICEEFYEKVIDAWNREQEEQEKKDNEKYEKRVYGNWKKLIKGLYIRERLKVRYNYEAGK